MVTTSVCKQKSAPNKPGGQVEIVTRRVQGDAELRIRETRVQKQAPVKNTQPCLKQRRLETHHSTMRSTAAARRIGDGLQDQHNWDANGRGKRCASSACMRGSSMRGRIPSMQRCVTRGTKHAWVLSMHGARVWRSRVTPIPGQPTTNNPVDAASVQGMPARLECCESAKVAPSNHQPPTITNHHQPPTTTHHPPTTNH